MTVTADDARLLAAVPPILARRFGGSGDFALEAAQSGNFNRIFRLSYAGRRLGVRAMVAGDHFRYEKTIIKEVFAAALLSRSARDGGDARLAETIDDLLARPSGECDDLPGLRKIHHYDWSLAELPVPYFIFDWTPGRCLWDRPRPDLYAAAGQRLATLHRFRFDGFYRDIFAIGRAHRPWPDHAEHAFRQVLSQVAGELPAAVAGRLSALDWHRLPEGRPSLIHNDFSGANLLAGDDGTVRVIDWDNWVVDCPELDLVKMKFWTTIGTDGRLTHDSRLYGAFFDAYRNEAADPVDPGRLAAYEKLWLLRCFAYEVSRQRQDRQDPEGPSWRSVYPLASFYREALASL
jgi:aminoglycoside phosphotransferase (APT) family kinase protein